ncbi:MAG: potassium transporter [Gammaproteobacteria bacterium HGW-Gammaproteobacteria-14]|nr:MAG: potassium transporter [Gammaproteobacteria bacterium HGW-Gammaproteobacteria-14]
MAGYAAELTPVVAVLGASIVAVTLFRRFGLGSVLGYLAAGLAVGPFGLALFADPGAILHLAELGVVMFLFVIGLEMQPSRLWQLRTEIFGLGAAQVLLCGSLLTALGYFAFSLPFTVALIAGLGFTLSSTAIVFQVLAERGEMLTPKGQRTVSILLLEDLAIVPLLILVAFLAPGQTEAGANRWLDVGIGVGAVTLLIVVGYWLLSPLFRLLAAAKAREIMSAAALLVVLGAALLMELSGLSMAMGAFLAGVLLSESSFRHQLEADIEPFRGLLLGLFFVGVGMMLDLNLVMENWQFILAGVATYMSIKGLGIYLVARLTRSTHAEGIYRTAMLAQGGEFGFVLFAAAAGTGLFDPVTHANFNTIVIISMALTPLFIFSLSWLLPAGSQSLEGVDPASNLKGDVLIIGFGRVGQVVSQTLLARGVNVSIIDTDAEQIRHAADFGFKVYYGDGTRLDVLHAAGAENVQAIVICVDDRSATRHIVELASHHFHHAKLLARAYDRHHALELVAMNVEGQVRETFESALALGEQTLLAIGVDTVAAYEISSHIRQLDQERFDLELAGGEKAGAARLYGNTAKTAPLVTPLQRSQALNPEAASLLNDDTARH